MLVCHLPLTPLDSLFLSLSLLDILTILGRKLRSYIFRRLVILLVTFRVSKACKVVEGRFQVCNWSVTFSLTTLDAQTVKKLSENWTEFGNSSFHILLINVLNIRLYKAFNYFQWGSSRNIKSSGPPIFCIFVILTPNFLTDVF